MSCSETMEDEKGKEREDDASSPAVTSQASGTADSLDESQEDPSDQPVRKSVRKRAPPPLPLSPSPPRSRIRKKQKGQPKRENEEEREEEESQAPEEEVDDEEEEYYSDSSSLVSEDPPFPRERAGIYAPLFRFRLKRQTDCIPVVRLPPRIVGGVRDQLEKTKVCNCKRSNCLKLYCDCFMAGLYCTGACNCLSCKNNEDHPRQRNVAIDITLMRNANAFRPQLQTTRPSSPTRTTSGSSIQSPSVTTREKGCHCRKSSCLKKVCIAAVFQAMLSHCQGLLTLCLFLYSIVNAFMLEPIARPSASAKNVRTRLAMKKGNDSFENDIPRHSHKLLLPPWLISIRVWVFFLTNRRKTRSRSLPQQPTLSEQGESLEA